MKYAIGALVILDVLFLLCCLVMPRSGMEAMGTMFVLIPLAIIHFILGSILSISSLSKKRWKIPSYFLCATMLMVLFWQLHFEVKPTYRPLYQALKNQSKVKTREFIEFKDDSIVKLRKKFFRVQNPVQAELCSSLEYPIVVENVLSALKQNPDLERLCPTPDGRKTIPIISILQQNYEPWRDDDTDHSQQIIAINQGVNLLLEHGANPNVHGENGNTPLHYAVQYNDPTLIKTILAHKACVHLENSDKRSVLSITMRSEIGKIIQQAALDPKMMDNCPQLFKQYEVSEHQYFTGIEDSKKIKELFYGVTNGRLDIVASLVKEGIDVNSTDSKKRTPLHLATSCKKEAPGIIDILLRAGADINARERFGNSPLMDAVKNHCPEVVEILLKKGADASLIDRNGLTALHLMASWDAQRLNQSIDSLIAAGISLETPDKLGRTPAMMTQYRSLTGDGALMVFLEKGAKPNARDIGGNTLLHGFASDSSKTDRTAGIEALAASGADLEIKNNDGKTPLMLAVQRENIKVALQLLQHGASPDVKTKRGTPLLHSVISCKHERLQLLNLLLQAGADVNQIDASGKTAMHRAFLNHLYLSCIEPVKILLENGAEINITDNNGMVPLHNIAHWEKKDAAELLFFFIEYGGEIDAPDSQGMTSLLRALKYGSNVNVTLALLNSGADTKVVDNRGNNIIHCVAMNRTQENIKQLEVILPFVTTLDKRNKSGETAMDLAIKYRNYDIAEKLEELMNKNN